VPRTTAAAIPKVSFPRIWPRLAPAIPRSLFPIPAVCTLGRLVAHGPEALERVELAYARQHDVDDDVAQVDQHPLGLGFALDAERLHIKLPGEAHDFIGDRLDVAAGGAG